MRFAIGSQEHHIGLSHLLGASFLTAMTGLFVTALSLLGIQRRDDAGNIAIVMFLLGVVYIPAWVMYSFGRRASRREIQQLQTATVEGFDALHQAISELRDPRVEPLPLPRRR